MSDDKCRDPDEQCSYVLLDDCPVERDRLTYLNCVKRHGHEGAHTTAYYTTSGLWIDLRDEVTQP